MSKFGWFKGTGTAPSVEYEADYIKIDKEIVEVRLYGTAERPSGTLIAAIRLDKGQDVRQLPSAEENGS